MGLAYLGLGSREKSRNQVGDRSDASIALPPKVDGGYCITEVECVTVVGGMPSKMVV